MRAEKSLTTKVDRFGGIPSEKSKAQNRDALCEFESSQPSHAFRPIGRCPVSWKKSPGIRGLWRADNSAETRNLPLLADSAPEVGLSLRSPFSNLRNFLRCKALAAV
jgi:hypothetical protein